MAKRPFFYKETHGFRISVIPEYLVEESDEEVGRFVFAYMVRIENCSRAGAQLVRRHWVISDAIGEQYTVSGDGVVGQQPFLRVGDVHEYRSFCVLKSSRGTMSGYYTFFHQPGETFDVEIPLFDLIATPR
jgi:ApaG protein